MSSASRERVEDILRRALDQQEFRLEFHPQIELADGRLAGFEALLRWSPGGGRDIPPDEFVPLLEASGQIALVGGWVIDRACRQWRDWLACKVLPKSCRLSINLSARQFAEASLGALLLQTVARYRLDPSTIEIELTETSLMQDAAHTGRTLARLRKAGIRIAVDDFGTGYCALAYLRRFPLDALKIDQSFIEHIANDDKDYAIVSSIICLAGILRLKTIAEGVETTAQLAALQRLHCDRAQGYLLSRPLAADAVPDFVRHWDTTGRWATGASQRGSRRRE